MLNFCCRNTLEFMFSAIQCWIFPITVIMACSIQKCILLLVRRVRTRGPIDWDLYGREYHHILSEPLEFK